MRSQRHAHIAIVLAVVVLVLQARVLLGGFTWNDVTYHTQVAPPRLAASEAILAGEAPTWWDGSGLGVPLVGEVSHGAAYPPVWLAASPRLLDVILVLHLLWLAVGVALWARRLEASELASVVAGVFALTTGVALSALLRGALPALAHVPWIGWAALGLARAEDGAAARRAASALGLLLGAVGLAGGSLALVVDSTALALLLGFRTGTRRHLAAALIGGLAITCAQWIPMLAVVGDGAGSTLTALKPSRLLELVLPGSFGSALSSFAVPALAGTAAVFPSLYVGASVFALAALAGPTRRVIALGGGLVVAALVVGRGAAWPGWLGAPELHLGVFAVLATAHAASGLDAVIARERRAVLALAGAGAVTALGLVAVLVLRSRSDDARAIDRAVIDAGLSVLCLAVAIAVAWRTRLAPGSLSSSLAIAALVVAPGVGALGSNAPIMARSITDPAPLWVTTAAKARDTTNPREPLRAFRPVSLYESDHDGSVGDALATLTGTSAARFGLASARSEDPARPRSHDRLWFAAAGVGGALLERYAIQLAILPRSTTQERKLGELGQRGAWSLVHYPAAPAAAMVFEWLWLPDDTAAIARLFPPGAGRGLPAGLVVLEGTGPEQQDEPRPPEPCTISRWTRGAIDMTCANTDPAYAVVSSTSARGWNVEVDGKATPWVTADVMRRAVALAPGAHVVSWRYEAPGMMLGLSLALTALIGLVGLGVLGLVGRRRATEPSDDAN